MELSFAPPERAKVFQCSKCPLETQKLRRCRETREDFTYKDNGSVFPIMVTREGEQFSFCPGKATWDHTVSSVYSSLMICAETGNLWNSGGISDQPMWFIELLSIFLMRYNDHKFYSRAQAILGDGKTKSTPSPNKTKGAK
jgi:hypothetical protein